MQRHRRIPRVKSQKGTSWIKAVFIGILLALAGIVAGLLLEGGHIGQVLQPTAAMIVFGGTLGAVMLQFPLPTVLGAASMRLLRSSSTAERRQAIQQRSHFANKARRSGIVSLDQDLHSIDDPFLKQAIMLAVDGTEPSELRKIMELQIDNHSEREESCPRSSSPPADSRRPSASSAPSSALSR